MVHFHRKFCTFLNSFFLRKLPSDVSFSHLQQADIIQIGMIGMGKIGARIAKDLSNLGMSIIYNNRRQVAESPYEYVSLDDLYTRADAIVLACPLTDATRHILNKESFRKMKDGVIVVNIGKSMIKSRTRRF